MTGVFKGRMTLEYNGRGWNYGPTSQGKPGATGSWKAQEKILSQKVQRENGPGSTLNLDF